MQGVFALWQLQGTVGKHFGDDRLQIKDTPIVGLSIATQEREHM